jgi:pimeloyl-ACP methyl ester carboxylesterase
MAGAASSAVTPLRDEDVEKRLRAAQPDPEVGALAGDEAEALRDLALSGDATERSGERAWILPGVMGSTLGLRGIVLDDVLWLDPLLVALGHLRRLAVGLGAPPVEPLGVILPAYLKLKLRLRLAGIDARFHAWDWRGDLLAAVEGLGRDLLAADGPVHLIGHSMGGLVAQALLALGPAGASARVASVVTLGTPSWGAPAIAGVLQGTHPVLARLALLDPAHDPRALAREVFGTFPSAHQLLPWRERWEGLDLDAPSTWSDRWPRPRADLLVRARLVQATVAEARPAIAGRVRQVIGVGRPTLVALEPREDGALAGATSLDGDGTVPRALAELPGAPAWYVDQKHGALANDDRVIGATLDLLRGGTTQRLSTDWTAVGGPHVVPPASTRTPARGPRGSWEALRRMLAEFVGSRE